MDALRELLGSSRSDAALRSALRDAGGDVDTAAAILLSMEGEGEGEARGGGGGEAEEEEDADEQQETQTHSGQSDDLGRRLSGKDETDEELARRLQREMDGDVGVGVGGSGAIIDPDEALARQLEREELEQMQRMGGNGGGFGASALGGMSTNAVGTARDSGGGSDSLNLLALAAAGPEMLRPLLDELKQTMLPEIEKAMVSADLPEIDEKLEEQSLDVQLKNLKVTEVKLPPDRLELRYDPPSACFVLDLAGLEARLEDFEWGFKKGSFPKLSGKGTGKVEMAETSVRASVSATTFRVTECDVAVGHLSVKLKGGAAAPIYNLVLAIFKSTLKKQLEQVLADIVRSTIEDASGDILGAI